jgi:hypothetical protein
MCEHDPELKDMLESAEINIAPGQERLAAVRERTLALTQQSHKKIRLRRVTWIAALIVLGVSTVGLAATETGRELIRHLFIPVSESHQTKWISPDGDAWTRTRNDEPFSPEEKQQVADEFSEIHQIKEAGGGRLTGLMDNPSPFGGSMVVYMIEYTLSSGEITRVGSGPPSGKQAENMRINEIMKLRDSGAGEILSERPSPSGMGLYVIRFTLSDGETIDLTTTYPPSTREERDKIFAEMWQLKQQRRFNVLNPWHTSDAPEEGVWGILQYTLSDGRIVGTVERLPDELISEDGQFVVLPGSDERIVIGSRNDSP